MSRSLMRNLLLSSCLICIFAGCHYGHYKRLKPYASVHATSPAALTPIFKDSFQSFLFKTNMSLYSRDFSGLLITKQIEPKDYRVVFTTELGMKLFDFEFKDTAFTLHYCTSQFNRPIILKTIRKDIEILLMNDLNKIEVLADKQDLYTVYRTNIDKNYNYYFVENASKNLVKIEHAVKKKKKIVYTLDNYLDNFPNHILIRHTDIKLKIELNLLKK
jgi:hypothetical protein